MPGDAEGATDSIVRRKRPRWRVAIRWDPMAIALLALVSGVARIRTPLISPYDEMYHLSYIQYLADGVMPRIGDAMNTWAREAFSCRDVFPFGRVTAIPCGEVGPPAAYPEGGTNTAAGWPPLYYAYAAVVVKLLVALGTDPVVAGRIASAILFAAGAGVVALAMRRLGASRPATYGASLILVAAPVSGVLGSFVSPHSGTLLLSGLALLFALRIAGETSTTLKMAMLAVGLGLLVGLSQPHAALALAVAGLGVAISEVRTAIRSRAWTGHLRRSLLALTAPTVALATYAAWTALQVARTVPFSADVDTAAGQQPVDVAGDLVSRTVDMWFYFLPGSLTGETLGYGLPERFLMGLVVVAGLAGLGAAISVARSNPLPQALAWAVLVVAPLSAAAMDAYFNFVVPLRYGFSLAPVLLTLLAATTTSRSARWLLAGAGSAAWAVALAAIWPQ